MTEHIKKIIVPVTASYPRSGEGSAVTLKDNRILFIYSRFTGGADHSNADLFGGILDPVNNQLSETRVFLPDADSLNQMSVSLERLQNGDIGMVFIRKFAPADDAIMYSRSADDGATWSAPVNCTGKFSQYPYWVVNNDRLRQLSSGRLVIPVNIYHDRELSSESSAPSTLSILFSDNYGDKWHLSRPIRIMDENIHPPHSLAPGKEQEWLDSVKNPFRNQEPGIEELSDGRILLYCRTTVGFMYQSYSDDGGASWSPLRAATDIVSPCGPQSIRRIPGTGRLIAVYNNRRSIPFYGDNWHWRTPLSLAVSDDNGVSWQTLYNLEDDSHNYCYASILFKEGDIILTYYQSENLSTGKRRNLATLKLCVLKGAEVTVHGAQ